MIRTAPLPLALLLIACGGNAGNIVGKWVDSSQNTSVTFGSDGTYNQTRQKGQFIITLTGTYTFSGDKLTINGRNVDFKGVPPDLKARMNAQIAPSLNHPQQSSVDFTTPDRIDLLNGPSEETFDRAK